jgi:hypothetical protein
MWVANLVASTGSLVGRECECFVVNDLSIEVVVHTYNAIDVVNPVFLPYQVYTIAPGQKKKCVAANGFQMRLRLCYRGNFSEAFTVSHNDTITASSMARNIN